jgi:hypothetical protein
MPDGQRQWRMKFFGHLLIFDASGSSHDLCHQLCTTKKGEQLYKALTLIIIVT